MAYLTAQRRPTTSAPGDGSRTITLTSTPPIAEDDAGQSSDAPPLTLRLRPATHRTRNPPQVAWDEGVVDNEGCGRKKSKICCIYHKPKRFDESSDESCSDSDSDSDSDSGSDSDGSGDRAQPSHRYRHRGHAIRSRSGGAAVQAASGSGVVREVENDEPNAYEVVPKSNKGKRKGAQG